MGKVRHYLSALDESVYKDFEYDCSIGDALKGINIENESLCVVINGECPDDCDLSYIIRKDDLIEIRKLVHGHSSKSKSNLALIIQIVALVAVTVLSMGTATSIAILLASGIAAGALNARAAKLALKEAGTVSDQDIDVATNNFSANSASNENRPLKNLPLPMGSIFFAPDYNAVPYKSYTGGQFTPVTRNIDLYFYPGGDYDNGVLAPYSGWVTMPANYIASGFPQVELMFPPFTDISVLKTDVLGSTAAFRNIYCDVSGYKNPIVCYHSDPGDPLYGRYNSFALHVSIYADGGANINYFTMVALFNMFAALTYNMSYFIGSYSPYTGGIYGNQYLKFDVAGAYKKYFPGLNNDLTEYSGNPYTDTIPKLKDWLLYELNGGDYGTSFKDKSFAIRTAALFNTTSSVIKEAYEYATHVFNFGIGDLTISDRKLEKIPIESSTGAGYSVIDKDTFELPQVYATTFLNCYNRIKNISSKNLFNDNSPETPIPINDNNVYNFAQLEGPKGYGVCHFSIAGRLYAATPTGMATNSVKLEIQYKRSSQEDWESSNVIYYENNNTKKFTKTEAIMPISISNFPVHETLQIRIRKITRDSVNNNDDNVCELNIENIYFIDYGLFANTPQPLDYRPKQIEGLAIVANSEMSSQTSRYAAKTESKCWVYDFDTETWSWKLNRNPAFWLLYFAYGGFLNIPADGTYSYPYSPTKGWVNYPGHPDNTEHIFGVGLKNEELDLDKILEWAQFCEDRELYLDMVLKDDTSCADVLERIANIGRGSISYYNGTLSVVYEDETQVPTCLFGMGNIIAGSFNVDYTVSDQIGKVVANFTDRDSDWDTASVEAPVPYADDDNLKVIEVSLEGVTTKAQAQREANILAARQFYQKRSYSFKVDVEGLIAKRGDLVYLSHDSTQYGFSGRVKKFIIVAGSVIGIETTAVLSDDSINHVTIRFPDGTFVIYGCTVDGDNIKFTETFPIEKASQFIDTETDNALSDYRNSMPEDFIFICGAKETPGKIVRISEIKASENYEFTITAVDEDPAMWAYEYNDLYGDIDPESFDDSELVLKLINVNIMPMGKGLVKINWEGSEFIKVVNEFTGTPIEANGAYSFSGGEVILELIEGQKYTLNIEPFAIGTPYKAEHKRVVVWA